MRRDLALGLALFLGTLLLFAPAVSHDFVTYDDGMYVTDNYMVQRGLSGEGVRWAFTTYQAGNWHPLTMLSHMLDVQLFGLNPAGHHATSILFHALNAGLVFLVFLRFTGALWPAALMAALFAWHPLRVESVAWVAERKDVLSTCFGLLALLAYHHYATTRSRRSYGASLGLFTLSLLAKPMLVTLPFLLLLLDVWPLKRWALSGQPAVAAWLPANWKSLLLEKLPFLALTVGLSIVTVLAQDEGGAVAQLESIPLSSRVGNAFAGYLGYLSKTLWPVDLAVLYPLPQQVPWGRAAAGALLLLGISAAAVWSVRKRPWFAVGWFWFAGTLVPVIGLVQVGSQSMADRYTYVPSLGLGLVFGIALQAWARDRARQRAAVLGAALLLLILAAFTTIQLRTWENTITLFRNATEVTRNNEIAHNNLGSALLKLGELDEALHHLQAAVRIQPGYAGAQANLGLALTELQRHDEARAAFSLSLQLKPDLAPAHYYLGINLAGDQQADAARTHLLRGVELAPHDIPMRIGAADVLLRLGFIADAATLAAKTVELAPGNPAAWHVQGLVKLHQGEPAETAAAWRKSLDLEPDSPDAWRSLGRLLATHPALAPANASEALRLAEGALQRAGQREAALLETLAAAQANAGRFPDALRTATEAEALARQDGREKLVNDLRRHLELYQAGQPLRETGLE